jgi:hypothetical protein
MSPAVLVEFGLEALRHPERSAFGRRIADRTGRAGSAASA